MTSEDISLIQEFEKIIQSGYYADGAEVTSAYNRILNKNVPSTNCSSCIRRRIMELSDFVKRMLQLEAEMQHEKENNTEMGLNERTNDEYEMVK